MLYRPSLLSRKDRYYTNFSKEYEKITSFIEYMPFHYIHTASDVKAPVNSISFYNENPGILTKSYIEFTNKFLHTV